MDNPFRKDFPLLGNTDYAYLDNAATSQRCNSVIQSEVEFYNKYNANPMRGLYELSMNATECYESTRELVKDFIGANSSSEIIFTRNTSESINLIAYSYGLNFIKEDDEIVVGISEHHSNMLPWQMVRDKTKCTLTYLECADDGVYTDEEIENKITEKTKLVAIAHISNVFGRVNPIEKIIKRAHDFGALVVIDGAQSVPHIKVNVKELDCDFYAFSAHKMLGPMGVGVLYGKKQILSKMPPFLRGGEMIDYVSRDGAKFASLPHKFEAGTVNAASVYAFKEAIKYIENVGYDTIHNIETNLMKLAFSELDKNKHVHIIGSDKPDEHSGIITFTLDDVHPHDIAAILDSYKVAVRAGHHCAQPLMTHLHVMSTTRASMYLYNTEEEVLRFTNALSKVRGVLGYAD